LLLVPTTALIASQPSVGRGVPGVKLVISDAQIVGEIPTAIAMGFKVRFALDSPLEGDGAPAAGFRLTVANRCDTV